MGLWSHAPRYLFARHLDPLLPQFGLHPIPGQPPSVQIRPGCENLFLRKQLALYQERQVQPRRATDATRLIMVLAARLFDGKEALISVRPETFTRWHRRGFRLFWQWKSRPIGRPRIPKDLRQLILTMARDNSTWG